MLATKLNRQGISSLVRNVIKSSNQRTMCSRLAALQLTPNEQMPNRVSSITPIRRVSTSKVVRQQGSSSQPDLFHIEDCRDKGYLILRLNKGPVNSLNLEFLTALTIQLDKIEQDTAVKGVILTSNCPNIFSAGLDILEMYNSQPERIRQFWSALQDFWMKLYGSSKIFVAAINGHAPAGGCLMSISCDYRVMATGPYRIGLNETLLVRK